ncbi:MAG: exodeoxyribonuclease VII small subunit [Pirellulaceae bacterium]|jgi:exodeoxyribonuclease VII small subunit
MAKKKVRTETDAPSFEDARDEVERIVRELEDGKLGLSDSLQSYEQGIRHLKLCYQILDRAERKIETLVRLGEDGIAQTANFDDEHLSLEEKAETRGRRRSASPKSTPNTGVDGGDDSIDDGRSLF